jgi:hypothetical protein
MTESGTVKSKVLELPREEPSDQELHVSLIGHEADGLSQIYPRCC